MEVFGIVKAVNSPSTGWYLVEPSTAPGITVSGVSLKATALSLGQRVSIFQLGHWGNNPEFGFAEPPLGLRSMTEIHPRISDGVMQGNPAQACLAYLAEKAGNHRKLYRPGTVVSSDSTRLTVKDEWANHTYFEYVAPDLDPLDFIAGDRVLIGIWPNREPIVQGWWQCVPAALSISPASASAVEGIPFSADFAIVGGVSPFTVAFSPTCVGNGDAKKATTQGWVPTTETANGITNAPMVDRVITVAGTATLLAWDLGAVADPEVYGNWTLTVTDARGESATALISFQPTYQHVGWGSFVPGEWHPDSAGLMFSVQVNGAPAGAEPWVDVYFDMGFGGPSVFWQRISLNEYVDPGSGAVFYFASMNLLTSSAPPGCVGFDWVPSPTLWVPEAYLWVYNGSA